MNRISEAIKELFPEDFEEFRPVKRRWWEKIDYDKLLSGWRLWLAAASLLVVVWGGIYYYNQFLNMELAVIAAAHQVEVTHQRRKDLLEKLRKTIFDYAAHERKVLRYVADKRTGEKVPADGPIKELVKSEAVNGAGNKADGGKLGSLLGHFMAVAENYPELKLSENFATLMKGILDVEKELVVREMIYNEEISLYGTYIMEFPQMFYNMIFRFRQYDYIQVDKDVHMPVPLDTGIDQTKE
jgi:LemA protein